MISNAKSLLEDCETAMVTVVRIYNLNNSQIVRFSNDPNGQEVFLENAYKSSIFACSKW